MRAMNDARPMKPPIPPETAAEILEPAPAAQSPWWPRMLRAAAHGATAVDAILTKAANHVGERFRVPPGGG